VTQSSDGGHPRPEEFPLGSPESRAAARAMLETRESRVRRLQIVTEIPRPRQDNSHAHVGHWQPMVDGGFMRLVYVPLGTDEETKKRLLDTP
jgi:hypothetical protein